MDGMMGGGALTPEQIQALMEYGVGQGAWSEQDREIQRQMAAAQALRNRPHAQHTTGMGAMTGGLGDMLNQYTSQKQTEYAQQQDRTLQQARIEALRKLAAAYGGQGGAAAPGGMGFLGAP